MNYRVSVFGVKPPSSGKSEWTSPNGEVVWVNPEENTNNKSMSGILLAIVGKTKVNEVREYIDLLRTEYDELFFLIAEAIEAREGVPIGSTRRMVRLARHLGKAINLSPDQLWVLEHSCTLRDIGKLRVSNEVLLKKSVLTYDEWVLLKSHAQLGANILNELGIFPEIAEIIAYHHESFDGDGYPLGLEGNHIPYLSRILRVLDVYCAMTSPRSYRQHVASKEEALNHLREERGKHFDPEIIDVFLNAKIADLDSYL